MVARPTTRNEILTAAIRRFAVTGFKGTSLQDIASDVGCSKAALLYHFANKEALLAELVAPATRALEALDRQLANLEGFAARTAAIEGFVDLTLRFRQEIALLQGELSELLQQPAFATIQRISGRLVDALAARSPSLTDRVAAMIVLAGVPAACVEFAPVNDDALRPILRGITRRALTPEQDHPNSSEIPHI